MNTPKFQLKEVLRTGSLISLWVFVSHMVAARNIKAGETILVEAPLTFGPLDTSSPICLGCYDPVKRTSPKCPRCNFPVCSASCSDESQHKDNECEFFVRHGFSADSGDFNYEGEELAYAIVSPIRYFDVEVGYLLLNRIGTRLGSLHV